MGKDKKKCWSSSNEYIEKELFINKNIMLGSRFKNLKKKERRFVKRSFHPKTPQNLSAFRAATALAN